MESEKVRENVLGDKYVLSLDVGTTTIRSMVYNKRGVVLGTAATPVRYHQVAKSITSSISLLPDLNQISRNSQTQCQMASNI